jgi:Asp/Glu/hydantoin racemase
MENQQKGIYDEASNRMVIPKIVALACAGYSTINSASDLGKEAGIPVLDSVIAAGLTIWHLGGGQYDKNQ